MEYNEENLERVSEIIRECLTSDLLPKRMNEVWQKRAMISPMFGHCHTASACLRKIFGKENIQLYRGLDDDEIYHWWAEDKNGVLIDITAEQYTNAGLTPPYDRGEKASPLGFPSYRDKINTVMERVEAKLNNKEASLFGEKNA